jgi:hypothetical protein
MSPPRRQPMRSSQVSGAASFGPGALEALASERDQPSNEAADEHGSSQPLACAWPCFLPLGPAYE